MSKCDGMYLIYVNIHPSCYIVSGKPSALYDHENPDWAPSIKLGHDKVAESSPAVHHRYERARKISRRQLDFDAADSLIVLHESANAEPSENLPRCEPLLDEVDGDTGITTQTEMTGGLIEAMSSEINNLTSEIAQAKSQLAKQEMSEHFFKFDDDKVRFYTGLQTYQILMLIFGFIQPHIYVNARSASPSFQQVIMTLMKLRLNLPVQDLAYRFGTSTSTISRVFTLVIDVMYKRLHLLLR